MTTVFAFVAVTISALDCPVLIDDGVALILTVGAPTTAFTVTVTWAVADMFPLPVTVMV